MPLLQGLDSISLDRFQEPTEDYCLCDYCSHPDSCIDNDCEHRHDYY